MEGGMERRVGAVEAAVGAAVGSAVESAMAVIKPRLRGWIHLGTFPLAVAAGIVLVALSPGGAPRLACAVFALTAALLFGTSALYHRGSWSPRWAGVLKRLDHSNIFLIIAGTYTPFAVALLPPSSARSLLWVVWVGAIAGVLFRVLWVAAPRWLYTPVYIALGWVAIFYLPDFLHHGGIAVLVLMAVGGALYTAGAIVYGIKRPNPSPRWFGFHEVFHVFTVAAFAAHYVAISMAVYPIAA